MTTVNEERLQTLKGFSDDLPEDKRKEILGDCMHSKEFMKALGHLLCLYPIHSAFLIPLNAETTAEVRFSHWPVGAKEVAVLIWHLQALYGQLVPATRQHQTRKKTAKVKGKR